MRLVISTLLVFAIGLGFLVRISGTAFSEQSRQRVKKRPILHCLWAIPGIFSAVVLLSILDPEIINVWPPHWLELRQQREIVWQRVQSAGGWERLRQDCVTFANTNQDGGIFWTRWRTNDVQLPASMSALKPQQVAFYPPSKEDSGYSVVHFRIFGMHRTGGHSTPYFGLDILTVKETIPYVVPPAPSASGNSHSNYRKVAEGVYEVY